METEADYQRPDVNTRKLKIGYHDFIEAFFYKPREYINRTGKKEKKTINLLSLNPN